MSLENLSIRDFYAGRSILITGATGFIGKVLVEKLLRSFPEIKDIYILIRPKRGRTVEQRINKITSTPLFEKLRNFKPDALKKIRAVPGDVSELGLGLSESDRHVLIENVSVVFHGAASVRFDDPLRQAIILNTRGTREIIKLALEIKNLAAFLHISTTYCQMDKLVVGEHSYPALCDWKKTIEIAEYLDEYTLDIFANKYMSNLPNSYTFSKALAENVVYDLCKDKIPAVIYRPSIVISTMEDPINGWIDNYNGPVALMVASGKGILRTSYADPNLRADYVPVDISVRALLIAAWQKGITKRIEKQMDVTFYNGSNNNLHSVTMEEIVELGTQCIWDVPLSTILWFPGGHVTYSKTLNYIQTILFQVLPAIVVDRILTMLDKKPILLKIQRRIFIANMALQVFLTNEWSFLNDNALGLKDTLLPIEREEYGFEAESIDVIKYFKNCLLAGRKYLLKEDESTMESARANLYRMYVLDRTVKLAFYFFVFWVLFYKIGIIGQANRIASKVFDTFFTWE